MRFVDKNGEAKLRLQQRMEEISAQYGLLGKKFQHTSKVLNSLAKKLQTLGEPKDEELEQE